MTTQRQYQEAVARCVSIMVFYHNGERTSSSLRRMRSEVKDVAGTVAGMAQPDEDPYRVDLHVEGELVARYGQELGSHLFADFQKAYETGSPVPCRSKPKQEAARAGESPVDPKRLASVT